MSSSDDVGASYAVLPVLLGVSADVDGAENRPEVAEVLLGGV